MSQCATVQKYFSSYIEHTLDPDTARLLEAHLSGCVHCSQAVADIRFLTTRFKGVQPLKTSQKFEQNLRARMMTNQPVRNNHTVLKTLSYGISTAVIIASVFLYLDRDAANPTQNFAVPSAAESMQKDEAKQIAPVAPPKSSRAGLVATTQQDTMKNSPSREEENRDVNLVGQ